MYLRFITRFSDGCDEECTGVFQAACYLRHSDIMYHYDKEHLDEVWAWFSRNLRAPHRFNRSRRRNARNISLSWFKCTAGEHLQMMYEMIAILEKYDITVWRVKAHRPGYIIYEDEYQVSGIPYREHKNAVL